MSDYFKPLLTRLKLSFRNPQLLTQAFTHRSYLNEAAQPLSSNERLEFLGDAILSLLVSQYLYQHYPQKPEGVLTSMRSNIVKTETLAEISLNLQFGQFLFLSRGEEKGGGRNNQSLLADTFEAFVGALYLDQGLPVVEKFLKQELFSQIEVILRNQLYSDYKSRLQEKVQENSKLSPTYQVIKTEGPDHDKKFWVTVIIDGHSSETGEGKSKQEAEQAAAQKTLEKMR